MNNNGVLDKNFILNNVAKIIPVVLVALMPLFFLPITTEFYAFNKLALLTIATMLLALVWVLKIVFGQKLGFTKSTLDLPLFALTIVMVLATIFSISKTDSIFGSQGRWVGLFSYLVLLAYYYVATPLFKDVKTMKLAIYSFLASSTVTTIVSVLAYYKIFLGSEGWIRMQSITLTGSIADGVLLAALAVIIALGLIAYEENPLIKAFTVSAVAINFFYVSIVRYSLGWAVLGIGVIGLLRYLDVRKIAKEKLPYAATMSIVVLVTLLTLVPATRNVLISKSFPADVNLQLKESWIVATSIVQSYPLLATGPGTFYLNFPRFKPLSLNSTSYWDTRFDEPRNELLNVLGSLGIVGLIVMLFFVGRALKVIDLARKSEDESGLASIASAAALALLAGYLFTYSTILNTYLLFFLLSFLTAIHALTDKQVKVSETVVVEANELSSIAGISETSVIKGEYFRYIIAVPIIAVLAYVGYLGYFNYAGEFYMRKSLTAASNNNGSDMYEFQRLAINANPNRDTYHSTYAQTNLLLANSIASKQDITEQDRQTIQTLIAQAIRSTKVATEVVGPLNVNNWEVRALIYRSIINVAQNAGDWALQAYNTSIQLDPSNPRLRIDLGGLYFAAGDYLTAANQFRQAAQLKSDYANAYYNFGHALVRLNDINGARAAFETVKSLVAQSSEDYKQVVKDISALPTPAVPGTQATKPTVEQLVNNNNTAPANQAPLKAPETVNSASGQNIDLGTLPKTNPNEPKQ